MLNLIGLAIFLMLLLGLLEKRQQLVELEQTIRTAPLPALLAGSLGMAVMLVYKLGLLSESRVLSVADLMLFALAWPVHEAGHVIFSFGGTSLHLFGGTLNELIWSLGPAAYCFWIERVRCGSLLLYWCGYELFHTAWYIGDAVEMKGALRPGDLHDWHYLLENFNMLDSAQGLSRLVWWVAAVIAATGLGIFAVTAWMGLRESKVS